MAWCFYLRRLTHNPTALHAIANIILRDISKQIVEQTEYPQIQLCGLETSSLPIIAAIQMAAKQNMNVDINAFTIRKERKRYGLFHMFDGEPNRNRVIVIDDLIGSGGSVKRCCDAFITEYNLAPARNTYCIVNKNKLEHVDYSTARMEVNYLFTGDEFDKKYDPEKYWLPEDCDRHYDKREHH